VRNSINGCGRYKNYAEKKANKENEVRIAQERRVKQRDDQIMALRQLLEENSINTDRIDQL
jgi:hypothetical protein